MVVVVVVVVEEEQLWKVSPRIRLELLVEPLIYCLYHVVHMTAKNRPAAALHRRESAHTLSAPCQHTLKLSTTGERLLFWSAKDARQWLTWDGKKVMAVVDGSATAVPIWRSVFFEVFPSKLF